MHIQINLWKWLLAIVIVVLIVATNGCSTNKAYVVHQGSIPIITPCPANTPAGQKCDDGGRFDSITADSLSETRAFLDSFKGKPEPQSVVTFLNEAEEYYQKTKASYLLWRTAQTAVNLVALNDNKTQLTAAVGKVMQAQVGGTK